MEPNAKIQIKFGNQPRHDQGGIAGHARLLLLAREV
jgi:hypothetical protein